jgi:hypothetical protein
MSSASGWLPDLHDSMLIGRAGLIRASIWSSKVVEDGYEFFAKRQLVTLFSAPNYCGEFDNAGGMMSVDETLMCSFQVSLGHRRLARSLAHSRPPTRPVTSVSFKILKPSEKKAKYQYGGMNTGRPVTPPRTAQQQAAAQAAIPKANKK